MIHVLLMLLSLLQIGYGDNLKLRFSIEKECSCDEYSILLKIIDHDHSVTPIIAIPLSQQSTFNGPVIADLPDREVEVSFEWEAISNSTIETYCCWRIVSPEIVVEKSNGMIRKNFNFRKSIDVCYSGVITANQLICTGNKSFAHSDIIELDEGINDVEVESDCTSTARTVDRQMCPSIATEHLSTNRGILSTSITTVATNIQIRPTSTISIAEFSTAILSDRLSSSTASTLPNILPTISPLSALKCEAEDGWGETLADETAFMVGACYDGVVNATRRCNVTGNWDSPKCLVSTEFASILRQITDSPEEVLGELSNSVTQSSSNSSLTLDQTLFLLNAISVSNSNVVFGRNFTKAFLNVTDAIIGKVNAMSDGLDREVRLSIGSQLLLTLDNVAVNLTEPTGETLEIGNLFLKVFEFNMQSSQARRVTGIAIEGNSITLPTNIFRNPSNNSTIRVGSLFYQNLTNLLLPSDNQSKIISPVISSTSNCRSCLSSEFNDNVIVQLRIEDLSRMSGNPRLSYLSSISFANTSCHSYIQSNRLPTGDWSSVGCSTIVNGDMVTCSCNHLTHFAILLSPGNSVGQHDSVHIEILNTTGLVLIPVSLVCMLVVILTYTLIKSLWSIRNYIHIMLCVSLSMAQLVFIIGVDKINNEGICSGIAVVLHYLFLVTFMWMLMEGVVLYITLIKVFVHNQKRYVIGFTIASYGVPALYMMLVVPLGYLVGIENIPGHSHYLYYEGKLLSACWLSYETGFIWSYIVPVAIINVVNIGFFVMAIVVMRSHSKKQRNKQNFSAKNWLKVCISLTLVLGITWLVGVLAFRKELIFIAYIVTVFIAGQGILLFIILIPLSKKVREAYLNCWHRLKEPRSAIVTNVSNTGTGTNSFNNEIYMVQSELLKANGDSTKAENVPSDYEIPTNKSSLELLLSCNGNNYELVESQQLTNYNIYEEVHPALVDEVSCTPLKMNIESELKE